MILMYFIYQFIVGVMSNDFTDLINVDVEGRLGTKAGWKSTEFCVHTTPRKVCFYFAPFMNRFQIASVEETIFAQFQSGTM